MLKLLNCNSIAQKKLINGAIYTFYMLITVITNGANVICYYYTYTIIVNMIYTKDFLENLPPILS